MENFKNDLLNAPTTSDLLLQTKNDVKDPSNPFTRNHVHSHENKKKITH